MPYVKDSKIGQIIGRIVLIFFSNQASLSQLHQHIWKRVLQVPKGMSFNEWHETERKLLNVLSKLGLLIEYH